MPADEITQPFPTDDPIVQEALDRFKDCQVRYSKIREKSENCHRFFVGGEKQWVDTVLASYRAQRRPDLTFNQLPQYVYNVLTEQLINPSEVKFSPDSSGASEDVARVKQDIVRKIRMNQQGVYAVAHAHRDHIVGGYGHFRICTEYASNKSSNQIIYLDPIESCNSVWWVDGTFPTYKDATGCIIFHDMPRFEFRKRWPNAREASVAGIDGRENEWLLKDAVRVMEYIRRVESDVTLIHLADGRAIEEKLFQQGVDVPMLDESGSPVTRPGKRSKVTSHKMTCYEQLEKPKPWAGSYIPIISIWGERTVVDDEVSIKGLLHDALDPQVASNFMQNEQLLNVSVSSKSPWLLPEGQAENMEDRWEEANRKAYSFIYYKAYDDEGRQLPQPIRNNAEPPVQAVQLCINSTNTAMSQSMGIYPPALGQTQGQDEPWRAVLERKNASKAGSYRFIFQLNTALTWLGQQLDELIPLIYDAPQIMTLEGLNKKQYQALIFSSQTQGAVSVDPKYHAAMGIKGVFDLSQGENSITTSTGPGYDTQRAEAQDFFAAMAAAAPALVPRFAYLWADTLDFDQKDALKAALMPPDLAMKDGNPAQMVPALQQQVQQMSTMVQHLSQAVQQLSAEKAAKITEFKGKMALQESENAHDEKVARIQLLGEAIKSHDAGAARLLDHQVAIINSEVDREHEKIMQRNEHENQKWMSIFQTQNQPEPSVQ